MNQEELKQRLIELLDGYYEETGVGFVHYLTDEESEMIANHLIANGVMIRERGEWKDNIFCSRCGYAAEDDEGHILMSFDNFCPHCGADMRCDQTARKE